MAEPVVGQALVGVAVPGRVHHQAAAEAEREGATSVDLQQAGAEPALVEQRGRCADRLGRCDRLAGVGAARCHRPLGPAGHAPRGAQRLVALEAAGGDQHATGRDDLHRPVRGLGDHPHHAVSLGEQRRHAVPRAYDAPVAQQHRQQPCHQRLAAGQRPPTALTDTVALHGRPDEGGDGRRKVGPQDRDRLDRAPPRDPTRCRVVLRERQPLEREVRVSLERSHQHGRGRQERLDLGRVRVLEHGAEVLARGLGRVRDRGALLDLAAGEPAGAAGVRRGAAAEVGLLQHGDGQAGLRCQRGPGQRPTPGADHDEVEGPGHRDTALARSGCARPATSGRSR